MERNQETINYPYLVYIVSKYIPRLKNESIFKGVDMYLFETALTHISIANNQIESYDRLEFLGDAVFHLAITDYLYTRYNEEDEGFITRLRIQLERSDSMAELTENMGLTKYIKTRDNIDQSMMEDVFEAFIGAFFLSFGYKNCKLLIISLMEQHKDFAELISHDDNYKDLLLQYFHRLKWGNPLYKPKPGKNTQKLFNSIVVDENGTVYGSGKGNTCKESQQEASKDALIKLGVIVDGEIDYEWAKKLGPKEKQKVHVSKISVYNPNNVLISKDDIKEILYRYQVVINIKDIKLKIYHEALTHGSYLKRKIPGVVDKSCVPLQKKSNGRLCFLGDAVVHFIIGDLLYHQYNDKDEGFMTKLRSKIENKVMIGELAKISGITKYVLISQSVEMMHNRDNNNIMGGAWEAFIGALYLQQGLRIAREYMTQIIKMTMDINKLSKKTTNYKDEIIALYKKNNWGKPEYRIIEEIGADHCKIFEIGIYRKNKLIAKGDGSSIKKAEQRASENFIKLYKK